MPSDHPADDTSDAHPAQRDPHEDRPADDDRRYGGRGDDRYRPELDARESAYSQGGSAAPGGTTPPVPRSTPSQRSADSDAGGTADGAASGAADRAAVDRDAPGHADEAAARNPSDVYREPMKTGDVRTDDDAPTGTPTDAARRGR